MASWRTFSLAAPELAAFGAALFNLRPGYLATVDATGRPRVHPVTPIIGDDELYLFTEPTSPKGHDLVERGFYALHNGVPDDSGSGGEFRLRGTAERVDDADERARAVAAARYDPADRYVLFRLSVEEARAGSYGDVELPPISRWADAASG
jgi:hypothetical protein